jgi:alpha-tubulin suppressor-like RCC1 family protein
MSGSGYGGMGIKTDGTLWTWGYNASGQLGDGTTVAKSSPIQIGSSTNWASLTTSGTHNVAIKTDGSLWGWGRGYNGGLGLGDTNNRSSPTQVGSLTNWLRICSGQYTTLAVKTDGTLWAWGDGGAGRLGLGDITNRSSPTQVGALTNWSKIANGGNFSLAVKTNGTLWGWGSGNSGRLGLGNTTYISSPAQVGALTNWSSVAGGGGCGIAIKTDGTLWALGGFNASGNLGLGNTTYYSSPKQVGSSTTWSSVLANAGTIMAVKTDGSLWAIGGYNALGALGLGDTNNRSSPNQVGALYNWSSFSTPGGGSYSIGAIKTDGTIWTWGRNASGQLGIGDTNDRSSPTQVGSLSNWLSIAAGDYHTIATKS